MGLYELLGKYIELMNLHNGPDSVEAKKFVEEHNNSLRFVRVARVASLLWNMRR